MKQFQAIYESGEYHVHKCGCQDILRQAKRLDDHPFTLQGETLESAIEANIRADVESAGGEEEFGEINYRIYPCVEK